ncbi:MULTISPECIES: DUF1934 domain-containing protein [Clostridium]|uniref:Beta-barrel protein YwiB n=4 Tax=Clostridium TaxID=1485 RepID=D8GKX5_CLOLD|nr:MULTISPECIES: DUF1934 domain-containing protein [Clostridium]ADK13308.1 conserved hypothetical protein [Clostridium ljungdahlii DSM 13528]AGY76534.1 DUF1934 domain-containing protein [Clostridium autoethanogenum DSM 10061]ALU36693.1 hypothetical protein CLAU_2265 [Clostridium autoethanogenum DSM 10061]OAA88926.1 putative beta-barrel protein YwiB [Clostridium ljungdahlii DSM 13528]OAA91726.1 putative beta-barrel protein YwiB [Clostridium coskatii]
MKKKAIIYVSSKQTDEEEPIEVVTPGSFYKKNDSYYAVYKETELSGMEGTTTTLKIKQDKFSLIRMGSTSTKMDFDKNKKNVSMYKTPYGTIELRIETNSLNINVDEQGGDIMINYKISTAGQALKNTKLKVNIKVNE